MDGTANQAPVSESILFADTFVIRGGKTNMCCNAPRTGTSVAYKGRHVSERAGL